MESVQYPESLIYPDSKIEIYFENKQQLNRTGKSIVIEGTRFGFLSLSNLINVYNAYLCNPIILTDFNFVYSEIVLKINKRDNVSLPEGRILKSLDSIYIWEISELNLFVVTGLLHSLGYANQELHLDTDLTFNEISVYCVVK